MKKLLLLLIPCTCLASPNGPYPNGGGGGGGSATNISLDASGVVSAPAGQNLVTKFTTSGTNAMVAAAQGVVSNSPTLSASLSNATFSGNVYLPISTNNGSGQVGVIYMNNLPFIFGTTASAIGNFFAGGAGNLAENTNGANGNVGIGNNVFANGTSGLIDDTSVGTGSGVALIDGFDNVFMGGQAGQSIQHGNNNVVVGELSFSTDTSNVLNTAIGGYSLEFLQFGDNNTALGSQAGASMTNGNNNVLLGSSALTAYKQGDYNIAIGYQAAQRLKNGTTNIFIGYNVGFGLTSSNNGDILIGDKAVGSSSDNNVTRIGDPAVQTVAYIAGVVTPSAGTYYPTNALTLATITSSPFTNGWFWFGNLSNQLTVVYMTNNTVSYYHITNSDNGIIP
jgi:hypothetical protein